MTDLQTAKTNLTNHTICLCKDGKCIADDSHGIAPIMSFIANGVDLSGYSVADVVVGKAAAMLFVKSKIVAVFAKTLSKGGKAILENYGISYEYERLVDNILNRDETDICPMEKTVANTDNVDEAYLLLLAKLESLKNK